jgi:hypothetical protein
LRAAAERVTLMRMRAKTRRLVRTTALVVPFLLLHGMAQAFEERDLWPFDEIAKPWFLALRAGDMAKLGLLTKLPFTYATTGPGEACLGKVRTADELKAWASCFRQVHASLLSKMETGSYLAEKTGGWGEPKQFPGMARKIAGHRPWTQAYLLDPRGPEYSFRFLVAEALPRPTQVEAFMIAVELGPEPHRESGPPHNRALQRPGLAPRR